MKFLAIVSIALEILANITTIQKSFESEKQDITIYYNCEINYNNCKINNK